MTRQQRALQLRVIKLRLDANVAVQKLEDKASLEIGRVILRETAALKRAIAAGEVSGANELMATYATALDAISADGADVVTALAGDVFDVSLAVGVDSLDAFRVFSPRYLAVTANAFRSDFRSDLITEGHARWYDGISEIAAQPNGALREAMAASKLRGEAWDRAAEKLLETGDGLAGLPQLKGPAAFISDAARARRIVRTESTRIDAAVSVGYGESAGVDHFANIGVGDTRQSPICAFASTQEPRTVAEWNALYFEGYRVGAPPRHPHCRCSLLGVPAASEWSNDANILESAGIAA